MGNCHLSAAYEIQEPSGKIVGRPTLELWANRPQPKAGVIGLGENTLGMTFKPTDALGTYTVRVAVTDHVAGITLRTRQALLVTEEARRRLPAVGPSKAAHPSRAEVARSDPRRRRP